MNTSFVDNMGENNPKEIALKAFLDLRSGEMSAFDIIYHLSKKGVYYAIYLIVKNQAIAEDLMQDTYVSFLDKINKLNADIDVLAYLVTMAKNLALNYYKRNKKELELMANHITFSYYEENFSNHDLLNIMQETLSEKEMQIFMLRIIGEYSFKEISQIMNIKIGTLTWAYQEARAKLEKRLGGK